MISESTKERPDQETHCNTSVSPDKSTKYESYLTLQKTVAAEVMREIAKDQHLSVAELINVVANDFELERFAIDLWIAFRTWCRLKFPDVFLAPRKGETQPLTHLFPDRRMREDAIRAWLKDVRSFSSES